MVGDTPTRRKNMTKRILSILLCLAVMLGTVIGCAFTVYAADEAGDDTEAVSDTSGGADTADTDAPQSEAIFAAEEETLTIKRYTYDDETCELTITVSNTGDTVVDGYFIISNYDKTLVTFSPTDFLYDNSGNSFPAVYVKEIMGGTTKDIVFHAVIADVENATISAVFQYGGVDTEAAIAGVGGDSVVFQNVLVESEASSYGQVVVNFLKQTGFSMIAKNWKCLVMIIFACGLLYLAIGKGFEPLLLVPIAFGMLLTNLPGAEMFHEALFANGHVHWELFTASENFTPGLIDYLYLGVKLGIYPCLIFFGVGAMTDFAPLIANPKSLLLGAAAQVGIFLAYTGASLMGFLPTEAASIGIIGGADGPTAIFVTSQLAPHLLGPIAVAAYSYMALVPVIQPPIMKLLTTKEERQIKMVALREVSKIEKILFPIIVTIFVALLVPSAAPLVGSLMLGNLFKESGVAERLSKTVQNELMNIVTIFLGISVGATATAGTFLSLKTLGILAMGIVAFACGTAGGLLLAKFMNLFLKKKINPLIGSAGVSAVPMAARVSQVVGQKENPSNFLLMHAMGPNVAGVIGSAIAAGVLIALFG